jgi:BCD family chlorophyll transporter-like MFS transporter
MTKGPGEMRKWILIFRMALFQLGFGLVSILVLGVLNRVMFAEIGLSATLIGFLLALPPLLSPLRLWLGYLSDSYPVLGYRRLPYILGGMVLATGGVFGGTLGALAMPTAFGSGVLLASIAFLCYGMGKNAMATTFQALIADVFDEADRPRATSTLKAAFILGIVGGSVGLGRVVDPYSPTRLITVVGGVALVAILLSIVGSVGVEPRRRADGAANPRRGVEMSFARTMRLTFRNSQVRLFFLFIGATLLATLSQDIFLEPYGATVFGMTVGETARLNISWGIGTLGALMLCGFWLVNRLGRRLVTAIGLVLVILAFGGIIAAGSVQNQTLFAVLIVLLGVGSGITGAGALTLMVDFTTPAQAGLLMGAWTIAHQLAEVIGNFMGGVLVDGVFARTRSYLAAFGTVFGLEIFAALLGLALLSRVDLSVFKARQCPADRDSLATVTR